MTDSAGCRAARRTAAAGRCPETGLRVDDLIGGSGEHAMTVRWHLAPGSGLRLTAGGAVVSTPAGEFRVAVSASSRSR